MTTTPDTASDHVLVLCCHCLSVCLSVGLLVHLSEHTTCRDDNGTSRWSCVISFLSLSMSVCLTVWTHSTCHVDYTSRYCQWLCVSTVSSLPVFLSVCVWLSVCVCVCLSVCTAVSLALSILWVPVKCVSTCTVCGHGQTCRPTCDRWRTWLWLVSWTLCGGATWLREVDYRPAHYREWSATFAYLSTFCAHLVRSAPCYRHLSVRPSICQTRAPWQNEIIVCKYVDTVQKSDLPSSWGQILWFGV